MINSSIFLNYQKINKFNYLSQPFKLINSKYFKTMAAKRLIRKHSHAGSWYEESKDVLNNQLTNWLQKAGTSVNGPAKVIIAPHAGYTYCGAVAAHAYKEIDPTNIKRIFILGPSHHVALNGCALTKADLYQTPLYNLQIDKDVIDELKETNYFQEMNINVDEEEHSIEMHLPYIAKVMEGKEFKIVPIMVGSSNSQREAKYGEIFSRYLLNDENLFVISTDFCHWGARFSYQFYESNWGSKIYQSIEKLDRLGMDSIEKCDPIEFKNYLNAYHNTVCGRNPIILILHAIQKLANENQNLEFKLRFLNYAQSSQCIDRRDSSVSYASASLTISSK